MRRALGLLAASFALLLAARPAGAINQPRGGPRIPVRDARAMCDLQTAMDGRREGFHVQDAAAITPERFVPGCTLTFTLVSRGCAGFQDAFGWYNVVPGRRPARDELHELIPCTARPGESFTLDLRREPAYLGGEIGFFLRTPEEGTSGRCADCCASVTSTIGQTYYSERGYNPDSMGADSYIHLLTYDSRVTPQAFYFAWEDLHGGGDNNFTDFVAQVTNIVCTGAGAPCATGERGACAAGTTQCRAGALSCVRAVTPADERCDGVDNDCDGETDEGDALCGATRVCDRGACVDRCRPELGCFPGYTCTERGACAEDACAALTCAEGQRCAGGRCVAACEDVACPRGRACRAGRCVDPCAAVTCDADQACVEGVCLPRCECRRCAAGQTCGMDGRCRPSDCAAVACPAGEVCEGGACRDACAGARCPAGEACARGECVRAEPDAGAPLDAGDAGRDAATDTGVAALDAGATTDTGSGTADTGFGMDAPEVEVIAPIADPRPGCACHTGASPRGPALAWALALVGLAARRRRS